jgi:hypothetical protein
MEAQVTPGGDCVQFVVAVVEATKQMSVGPEISV